MRGAIPVHNGDWYFTGNYPTPGGIATLNRAYINYFEKKTVARTKRRVRAAPLHAYPRRVPNVVA